MATIEANTKFPPIHLPPRNVAGADEPRFAVASPMPGDANLQTADRGVVRLGDCMIGAAFPPLRGADPRTTDSGKVRLGDCMISAVFPSLK